VLCLPSHVKLSSAKHPVLRKQPLLSHAVVVAIRPTQKHRVPWYVVLPHYRLRLAGVVLLPQLIPLPHLSALLPRPPLRLVDRCLMRLLPAHEFGNQAHLPPQNPTIPLHHAWACGEEVRHLRRPHRRPQPLLQHAAEPHRCLQIQPQQQSRPGLPDEGAPFQPLWVQHLVESTLRPRQRQQQWQRQYQKRNLWIETSSCPIFARYRFLSCKKTHDKF
jgi:hypothetical protein